MKQENTISIAVLTGKQEDVEAVNAALRSAGYAARCHWITDPTRFDEALAGEDGVELIILYNANYPDDIRQVVKQKDTYEPELPVICVQDKVDEAAMQAVMKFGARDLVSAAGGGRWLAVVERELRALRLERALNSTVNTANQYKRQLHDYMQRSDSAIAYAQDGIVTRANSAWLSLFMASGEDEIVGLPLMDSFEPESHAAIKGALVATVKGKWQADEKLDAKSAAVNDDGPPLEMYFQLVEFEDGPHVQVEIVQPEPVVEEPTKLVHDALQRDPTTLFYHRTQFVERLEKRLAKKPGSGIHAVAYIRPDRFAAVQKDVGILASEELLAQLAEVVRSRLHPRDFAGRFEGTALMVLLERGSEHDAELWAQQLIESIHGHEFESGETTVELTCTVGVCAAGGVYATLEELIGAVTAAYQSGRKSGGNTVHLQHANDEDTRMRRFDEIWVRHIRSAMMDKRFRLAHLPIAGLRMESGPMFDMLVRMLDEQGNPVLPSEFLPAAERNNLMKTIDRWIITASIDFCKNEKAERVFIRLSRQSMKDATLVEWVGQELSRQGVEASRICMQATERDAAKEIKQTRKMVEALRKLGAGFALEHYGVDRNRFQILDILQPDYIKIDGELMHSLAGDTKLQENVRALAAAADGRGIRTIAERVENANAMAVLFQLGVHFMQGHYVHEPEVVLQEPAGIATSSLGAIANN